MQFFPTILRGYLNEIHTQELNLEFDLGLNWYNPFRVRIYIVYFQINQITDFFSKYNAEARHGCNVR